MGENLGTKYLCKQKWINTQFGVSFFFVKLYQSYAFLLANTKANKVISDLHAITL